MHTNFSFFCRCILLGHHKDWQLEWYYWRTWSCITLLQEVAVFISFFVSALLHEVNLLWLQTLVIFCSVFKLSLWHAFVLNIQDVDCLGEFCSLYHSEFHSPASFEQIMIQFFYNCLHQLWVVVPCRILKFWAFLESCCR